jgi:hypothetical protein
MLKFLLEGTVPDFIQRRDSIIAVILAYCPSGESRIYLSARPPGRVVGLLWIIALLPQLGHRIVMAVLRLLFCLEKSLLKLALHLQFPNQLRESLNKEPWVD